MCPAVEAIAANGGFASKMKQNPPEAGAGETETGT